MAYQNGHESHAKKLARAFLWARIREYAKPDASALVLAGTRAGDVLTAECLGFDRRRFVAVDRDPNAIFTSRNKAGGVRYRNAELDTFANRTREQFDVIFLDFCSTMTPALAGTFANCVHKLSKPGSVVGLCFMYGRESPSEMQRIAATGGAPHEQRFRYAKALLDQAARPTRFQYVQLVRYVSVSPGHAATPMVCVLMTLLPPNKKPARYIPVEDLKRGEMLESVVTSTAQELGAEQASQLFSLKRTLVEAWCEEADRGVPHSYKMRV